MFYVYFDTDFFHDKVRFTTNDIVITYTQSLHLFYIFIVSLCFLCIELEKYISWSDDQNEFKLWLRKCIR